MADKFISLKNCSTADLPGHVRGYIKRIVQGEGSRYTDFVRFARLYGCSDLYLPAAGYEKVSDGRYTLNVTASTIDALTSKLSQDQPLPIFLTEGGNWELQQRCKMLNQFIEGQFFHSKIPSLATQAMTDSLIFNIGVLKVFESAGEIRVERVLPLNIFWSEFEALHGSPRQIHQRELVNREVLVSLFPKNKAQILTCPMPSRDSFFPPALSALVNDADLVEVVESWLLPTGKKSPGRHCITIPNAVLLDEDWSRDHFPFVFLRMSPKPFGFLGQGFCERLQGVQLEINRLLVSIQKITKHVCVPKLLAHTSSQLSSQQLNNVLGGVIKWSGTYPPTEMQLGHVPVELFQQVENLYRKAFEVVGVSQLSAQAKKPSGLNSGRALTVFEDIESDRFNVYQQAWQQFHIEIAEQMIELCREIAVENPDFSVWASDNKQFVQEIKWKDVDLSDQYFRVQVFSTSALSKHPAARLQEVQQLCQAGLVSPETGAKLLAFPDLDAQRSLEQAAQEVVQKYVESIVLDGVYREPNPYMDLSFAITYATQRLNLAEIEGVPEERKELLRRFIERVDELGRQAVAQQAPQQASAQAIPEPRPVSDLLSNVPTPNQEGRTIRET